MLGTVCRAGDLLDLFDGENPEWGATAVSRRLDITKSQAHEMLVSLESIGLLRRAGRGRFRLGWKTVTLSKRLLRSELSGREGAIVRGLGEHLGTSVDLITHDGGTCVRIGGYGPSNYSEGPPRETGRVSAAGKILLASMSEERANDLLPEFKLEPELAAVRERGLAFEESSARRAVAAPVFDATGTFFAALAVAVTPSQWNAKSSIVTRAVVGTARKLSETTRSRADGAFGMSEPRVAAAAAPATM